MQLQRGGGGGGGPSKKNMFPLPKTLPVSLSLSREHVCWDVNDYLQRFPRVPAEAPKQRQVLVVHNAGQMRFDWARVEGLDNGLDCIRTRQVDGCRCAPRHCFT